MGNDIRSLNKEQLKGIIRILKESETYPKTKYFEFDIDQLPNKKLRELEKYVKECISLNNKNNNKQHGQNINNSNKKENLKENKNNKNNNNTANTNNNNVNSQQQMNQSSNTKNKEINKNMDVEQDNTPVKKNNKQNSIKKSEKEIILYLLILSVVTQVFLIKSKVCLLNLLTLSKYNKLFYD